LGLLVAAAVQQKSSWKTMMPVTLQQHLYRVLRDPGARTHHDHDH
jgi:hypothetical protein